MNLLRSESNGISRRTFLGCCGRCAVFLGSQLLNCGALTSLTNAQEMSKGLLGSKLSPYFEPLPQGRVRCTLCPNGCEVAGGERGHCRVRENRDGKYYSLVYGNPCAVHIDPVEKKPFYHVLPSTTSFSLATAGCNFECKFCQNWEISQARPEETLNYNLPPEKAVEAASRYKCASIACTYVEPTIFMEYMLDIFKAAKPLRILNVMHSNGFINTGPLDDLCNYLDAACIDLKGFRDEYYRDMSRGRLDPVLATLKHLKRRGIHIEIVNLIVTGRNDDIGGIRGMCKWIAKELGPDVPVHFTRFYPLYKLKSLEPTPISTLEDAWNSARQEGLQFAYIGNVPGHPAENTNCPKCGLAVIERIGHSVKKASLKNGKCSGCGRDIPGIWKVG